MSPWKDPEYAKEYYKAYYQKNKEKKKAYAKEYREKNKEKKSAYDKEYREKNLEKLKEKNRVYKQKHKERLKQQNKEYYSQPEVKEQRSQYHKRYKEENLEKLSQKSKEYYQNNKERILEKERRYREENREKIRQRAKELYTPEQAAKRKAYKQKSDVKERQREWNRHYRKERYRNDVKYKLTHRLRGRLYNAIKNNCKSGSAIDDLGCTIEELKVYLESQFKEGMTWDNWTNDGWHIDHKKQLSTFDLSDREQFLEACHYTNLQPLWWWENLEKRVWE